MYSQVSVGSHKLLALVDFLLCSGCLGKVFVPAEHRPVRVTLPPEHISHLALRLSSALQQNRAQDLWTILTGISIEMDAFLAAMILRGSNNIFWHSACSAVKSLGQSALRRTKESASQILSQINHP